MDLYASERKEQMSGSEKKFKRDLLLVVGSNVIVLISSIVTGFIIPKILGVHGYGIYKMFTLYLGYGALLHFGYVDGILLNYAGNDYETLDLNKFRTYTYFFVWMQIWVSGVFCVCSFFLKNIYRWLMILLGIDIAIVNVTTYYQFISQGTMRFKELSIRNTLKSIFKIVLAFTLFFISNIPKERLTFEYIIGTITVDALLLLWYVYTYREITFGSKQSIRENRQDIKKLFRTGIILTISYQVAQLIFLLDQQYVALLFDTNTYGIYSFAYNLIHVVITVIGAVSLVLFPTLKRKNAENIVQHFSEGIAIITVFAFFVLIGYYPLCGIITKFLPNYQSALIYLQIMFPGLVLTCCINMIMFTYYKALNIQKVFLKKSVIVLVASIILNMIAYIIFKSPVAISVMSIIVLFIWYIICEMEFVNRYAVKWKRNFWYTICMAGIFYMVVMGMDNKKIGCMFYAGAFMLLTKVCYGKNMRKK